MVLEDLEYSFSSPRIDLATITGPVIHYVTHRILLSYTRSITTLPPRGTLGGKPREA